MQKNIRRQIYRMVTVFGLMIALGVWQFDFLWTAVNSNLFLNGTIFGTFFFGVYLVFRNVFALDKEVVALNALKEHYSDIEHREAQNKVSAYWRYYRCEEPAIVFTKPNLLEQPYDIITEEIGRTKNLEVSTGVMQNLTDSLDERLDDQKSLLQYVTGLLVFLGLIGTFVGLMLTLGSVGDILGSIDVSGGGGAGAIQSMMDSLKTPLKGMATGFSSSLFGLITSLGLGLMCRFGSQAGGILKQGFQSWLAGVVKVRDTPNAEKNLGFTLLERQALLRVAQQSVVTNARILERLEQLTSSDETTLKSEDSLSNSSIFVDEAEQESKQMARESEQSLLAALNESFEPNGKLEQAGIDDLKVALAKHYTPSDTEIPKRGIFGKNSEQKQQIV